jgi:sortase A
MGAETTLLNIRALIILLIAGLGFWQTGSAAWIYAKAQLAQVLLERAWEKTLAGDTPVRPWPWADTWPVARLRIPSRDVDVIVLQGDSGRSLAFAPGMAAGSAPPGQPGTTLISAHRDTHFKNIADIQPGEQIELETPHGRWTYRVLYTDVVDARRSGISSNPLHDELVLVTCYPFGTLVHGGPFRLVIRTEAVSRNTGVASQHGQTTTSQSITLATLY